MGRVFNLLIVDEDPCQVHLVEAMLRELGLGHQCYYAPTGLKALDFLRRVHPFEQAPRPQLILLDSNLSGMCGCEVLHHLKSDPDLLSIPVIMLSSTDAENEVKACYQEHANAYVKKPADYLGTLMLLRDIDRFWAESALLAS